MARGWESKSVEGQIESFEGGRSAEIKNHVTSAQADLKRKKESLRLARARVLRDLEATQNPRYRDILSAALADLEGKLTRLD
ncbi:MAG TPA: hypothetical protein VKV95_20620 [Terriglobia bacterium]|nr:hypothetical protein [Terriglobia bacterium]